MRLRFAGLAFLYIAVVCRAQKPAEHRIDVTLEQKHGVAWSPVEARTVFKAGDEIRFVFETTAPGYLYVLNVSPAGQYHWLYPAKDSGLDNRVVAGQRYLVPATAGSFVMPDKPGFETLYWVLSPDELHSLDVNAHTRRSKPSTLLPRCSPEGLQARGACMDNAAGPKPAGPRQQLPAPLAGTSSLSARELTFENGRDSTQIRFFGMNDRAIIYEFWIAHR